MYTPTMLKRSAVGAVYDIPAAPTQKILSSNVPMDTKVLWLTDPSVLVGPREEDARRRGPEMKFLVLLSTFLTLLVMWGIFREVNNYVPKFFHRTGITNQQEMMTLDPFQANALGFQSSVNNAASQNEGRYMEAKSEHFPEETRPRKLGFPHTNKGRQIEFDFTGSDSGRSLSGEAAI